MPRLEALLFDLDGTLLNSAPDILHALNLMLESHDRRELTLAEMTPMLGDGVMPLVQRAFQATGGAPEGDIFPYVQEHIQYYRAIEPDPSQVYPLVRETLALFAKAGVKMAVCTNKQTAASKRILSELDLLPFFSVVAGGDAFEVHKPHPGHILGILKALDVTIDACAFVGDGPNDIAASRNAKVPCIAVTHGYGAEGQEAAEKSIDGFDALPQALKDLGFVWAVTGTS